MSWTYLHLELRRLRRDPVTLFFALVMPVAFYLAFVAVLPASQQGNDRLRAATMMGLAGYGAATAACAVVGQAALERAQGWGRQLALTPLGDRGYLTVKAVLAAGLAVVPVALVLGAGIATGVRVATPGHLLLGAAVLVLGTVEWALYGLVVGLGLRSQSALALAQAGLVLFSFAGGALVPLDGVLAVVAPLTPMYGHVALARVPVVGTAPVIDGRGATSPWLAALSLAGWTALLAWGAAVVLRRSRTRG